MVRLPRLLLLLVGVQVVGSVIRALKRRLGESARPEGRSKTDAVASDHPAAAVISGWIKQHTTTAQQGNLFA
ncbi:MAG: hypothetical protein Q8R92_04480 [Deltaproteobacteria bacterium]|nr:hypothetical protein [Deltaproteobacteria bacterium]